MNARNVPESSTCSLVCASTSSHTTASDGAPLARATARCACSEIWVSISCREIAPSCANPSSSEVGDHDARVLARDIGEDQVAGGIARDAREQDHVADRVGALEHVKRAFGLAAARDDPKVDHVRERTAAPEDRSGAAGRSVLTLRRTPPAPPRRCP